MDMDARTKIWLKKSNAILLNQHDLTCAAVWGQREFKWRKELNLNPGHLQPRIRQMEGCVALAKLLGRLDDLKKRYECRHTWQENLKRPLVVCANVRVTDREDGKLFVNRDDDMQHPICLILSHQRPVFIFQGWGWPKQMMHPRYWTKASKPGHHAWAIPPGDLRPSDELLEQFK